MPNTNAIPPEIANKAKVTKALLPTLSVSICGKWVWVSGETRAHASTLSGLGFRFSRQKTKWYFGAMRFPRRRAGIPWGQIVSRYGQADVIPTAQTAVA